MTVTANTTRNDYTAGLNQVDYEYTFQIHQASDVDVYLNGVKQTLNTHYTIDDIGNATGGTVTFTLVDANGASIPPPENAIINIVMAMDLDRDTNYQPSGAFLASTVNNDFDRLWHSTNQQQTAINRSLRLQDTDVTTSSMELPLKDARKGKLLAFNASTGDPEATSNNQSNWDAAYNDKINSAAFGGSTLTLTQQDGGTVTASHTPYLPLTGGTVSGDVEFGANKAKFLTLEIYNTIGNNSFIKETGAGNLFIQGDDLRFQSPTNEDIIKGVADGGVTLYFNNNPKLETTNAGITVTGTLTATGYNDTNWNTAYGWGDHSQSGYLTAMPSSYNNSNWDTAYNNHITGVNYSGSTLTLTQQDGGTLTTTINAGGSSQWTTNGSNIHYNSGNVGIGTDSPNEILVVKGGTYAANQNRGMALQIGDTSGSHWQSSFKIKSDGAGSVRTTIDASTGAIGGQSQEAISINTAGRVGIGTSSPSGKLHVSNGSSGATVNSNADDLVIESATNAGISILGDGNETQYLMFGDAANSAVGRVLYDHNTNHMGLWINGTESVRINLGGNVGIGTSSIVDSRLHLKTETSCNLRIEGGDPNSKNIVFAKNTGGAQQAKITAVGENLYFTTGATHERMRIDSSGNVGIGTTTPAEALHVTGNIAFGNIAPAELYTNSAELRLGVDKNNDNGSSDITFYTNDDEKVRINKDGKVGIGTTNPLEKLDVAGSIRADDIVHVTGTGYARLEVGGGTGAYIDLKTPDSDDYDLRLIHDSNGSVLTSPNSDLELHVGGTQRLKLKSGGNVGIGVDDPQDKLHVNGTVRATDLYITGGESYLCRTHATTNTSLSVLRLCAISTGDMADGFGTGITFDAQDNSGTTQTQVAEINAVRAGADNVFNLELQTGDVARLTLGADGATFATGTSGTDRLKIDSSGNVGIGTGTNTISQKLHVQGHALIENVGTSGSSTANLELKGGGGGAIALTDSTSDPDYAISNFANIFSIQQGSDVLFQSASGNSNVGIGGASDDTDKLKVHGTVSATTIQTGDGSASAPAYTFSDDTNTGMYSPAADTIAFSEGGTERMRIDSNGKVLINTTSAGTHSSQMRVNGRIHSNSIYATSNSSKFFEGGNFGYPTIQAASYSSYSSSSQKIISFTSSQGTEFGSIAIVGAATAYNTSSDERLKENIQDANDAGSKIDGIRVRQFDWKSEYGGEHQDYGVIAQELQTVAPEAVSEGYTEDDMMSVDYSKLVPTLIKEIQSLRTRVAQLENN